MTVRRGDGLGLEITSTVIRGVRLAQDEPRRAAAVCEVPISRFEDAADVLDALVRARGRLGDVALPTRVAWFPPGSTLQRTDVTGRSAAELNQLRHRLADDLGVTSTMLVDLDARRWMLALRWDHQRAWWLQELVERAGFVDVTIEPAPLSLERTLDRDVTIARRDASAERCWVSIFDRLPVAAATIECDGREHPGLAATTRLPGVTDLDEILDEQTLAQEVARVAALALATVDRTTELDARLRVLDEPYPPFPSHDLRAPQRVAVALGAGIGAAGLAGRLREVDVLTALRPTSDITDRPWAVERVTDVADGPTPRSPWGWARRRRRSVR
ncbi:MAG TPA: hypothetical protein VMY16_02185 [Ilumatobacteraceae bacterium]|nr:hypothetical protein [Ilumatobacteraceae bacterium]